ncbi:MAG: hypothetical protein C0507_11305 [Cyanobacteria bacterium PR.3.49]|nr:hypothetical protein [Cyanobacteria bacterium PR.3.49]
MFYRSKAHIGNGLILAVLFQMICTAESFAIPSVSLLNATVKPKNDFESAVGLLKQRQFGKAEIAFKQLLPQLDGRDNKKVADILNYIGVALRAQKKENEAARYFRLALAKLPADSSKEKIMRAKVLSNLSSTYLSQKKIALATETCSEAVTLFRLAGGSPKDLAVLLNTYGRLKMENHDFKEAESLFNESLKLRQKASGDTSIEVLAPLINLSALYLQQKRFSQAEQVCQRALDICQQHEMSNNALFFSALSNLAEAQLETEQFRSAAATYKHALKISDKQFGAYSQESLAILLNLSEAAEGSGQREIARETLRRAVDLCRIVFGSQDNRTLQATEALADLEQGYGNLSEARRLRFLSRLSRKRSP